MKLSVKKLLIGLLMVISLNNNAAAPRPAAESDTQTPPIFIFTPNILSGETSVDPKTALLRPDEASLYGSPVYLYVPGRAQDGKFIKYGAQSLVCDVYSYEDGKLSKESMTAAAVAAMQSDSSPNYLFDASGTSSNLGHIAPLDDYLGPRPKECKLALELPYKDKFGDTVFAELRDLSAEEVSVFETNAAKEVVSLFDYRGGRVSPTAMLAEISASVGGKFVPSSKKPCTHAVKLNERCFSCFIHRSKDLENAVFQVSKEKFMAEAKKTAGGAGGTGERLE